MSKVEYKNLIAFHPGYYLKDIIGDMDMTQDEFAKRLGTSAKNLSELLSGKITLSTSMATKLSNMLGTNIDFWLNLQQTYEKKIAEIEEQKKIDEEIKICKMIDYSYFVNSSILPPTRDWIEKIKNLRVFLKISRLTVLQHEKDFLVNYRSGVNNKTLKNLINARVWVQTAINLGENVKTNNYNKEKLINSLPEIRAMTNQAPKIFFPRLRQLFSECGVSFVLIPNLKSCGINGAVKWLNHEKVILAMNDRRLYADTFWFSLFHEIKHILQHKTKELIVSLEEKQLETFDERLEQEADEFARNKLIPPEEYTSFIKEGDYSLRAIEIFSQQIGIHPGIVVGRLQKDSKIDYSQFNHLKQQYIIS